MIEAYCVQRSVLPGETVDLCVSTSAEGFDVRVRRMGTTSRRCVEWVGITGTLHDVPNDAVENGCGWPASLAITPESDWVSGFYKVELKTSDGELAEAFFVLRAASPRSSILWVIETNTWNAYNTFGGASTYTADGGSYIGGASRVSFERPLPKGFITLPAEPMRLATVGTVDTSIPYIAWAEQNGSIFWTGAASWDQWAGHFLRWLDEQGIHVDYAINSDLQDHPELLSQYRLMLSIGHDEYWSWEMRDTVEAFISKGGNVAFLSGNTAFWQVRLEQNGRQMVAFKASVEDDPVMGTPDERHNTGMWSHRKTHRPENTMTGVSFTRGGYARMGGATPASAGGYTVYRADHWALEGTGLSYGDQLGAAQSIVGYECDGCVFQFKSGLPVPTGEDGTPTQFEIIGIAPVALWTKETALPGLYEGDAISDLELVSLQLEGNRESATLAKYAHGHAVMGAYSVAGGGTVFASGTTDWVFGLPDPQVSRITSNILARLSNEPVSFRS